MPGATAMEKRADGDDRGGRGPELVPNGPDLDVVPMWSRARCFPRYNGTNRGPELVW